MKQFKACRSPACTYQGQACGEPFSTHSCWTWHWLLCFRASSRCHQFHWSAHVCACIRVCTLLSLKLKVSLGNWPQHKPQATDLAVWKIFPQAHWAKCDLMAVVKTSCLGEMDSQILFDLTNYKGIIKPSKGMKSKGSLYDMKRKSWSHK